MRDCTLELGLLFGEAFGLDDATHVDNGFDVVGYYLMNWGFFISLGGFSSKWLRI